MSLEYFISTTYNRRLAIKRPSI